MKNTITLIALLVVVSAFAQISVKAEYIGNSKFYDAVADTNTGDVSATIYSASAMLPLWTQAPDEEDPYKRATIWGVALSGTFVKMENQNFPIGKAHCPRAL